MSIISAFPGGGAEIEGNALPANVEKGVTFMSANSDEVQTGTKVPQGTATPSQVLAGYTFESAASEGLQTGAYTPTFTPKTATVELSSQSGPSISSDNGNYINRGYYTAPSDKICAVWQENGVYGAVFNGSGSRISMINPTTTYESAGYYSSRSITVSGTTIVLYMESNNTVNASGVILPTTLNVLYLE